MDGAHRTVSVTATANGTVEPVIAARAAAKSSAFSKPRENMAVCAGPRPSPVTTRMKRGQAPGKPSFRIVCCERAVRGVS